MLLGVERPESLPLPPVPRLMPLSLAGETPGLRPVAGVGRFAGGAGGVGFARVVAAAPGPEVPFTVTAGVGIARGGAAGGGGGGGGAARACSISST